MLRLDWSLSRLVTQDIKTQPQSTPFNYNTKKVNLCTLFSSIIKGGKSPN